MAAAIQEELGFGAELIKGGSGIFEVVADGKTLFSKHQSRRFPEDEEVLSQLRS